MRVAGVLIPVFVFASGSVEAGTPFRDAMAPFTAELTRQCPSKRLELSSPAGLRDVLDDYKARLRAADRRAFDRSEARHCADSIAGASCFNAGDAEAASRRKLTRSMARFVCANAPACRAQSDC